MPLACSSKHALDALAEQERHAVDLAAAGQRRLHPRHRPGVAVAAGGRDLGPAPRDAPRRLRRRRASGLPSVRGRRRCRGRGSLGSGSGGGGITSRDAAVVLRPAADVEVGAERLGDLVAEERAERCGR